MADPHQRACRNSNRNWSCRHGRACHGTSVLGLPEASTVSLSLPKILGLGRVSRLGLPESGLPKTLFPWFASIQVFQILKCKLLCITEDMGKLIVELPYALLNNSSLCSID
ncbi:hypothetical protein JCGZ_04543 [Jatropha curcas]|uniref:Uncharacterized protein n=1 Tax=Jatropha curcas TaxID=180498 RepID=A0A067LPY4_JATCU|nr:hypothetical protein JCGZ_04543 [Jatropha curcas]